jgi:ATP-dependent HslUV protease subunit HslV
MIPGSAGGTGKPDGPQDGKAAIGADGQVSFNNTILKHHTKKVRKVHNGQILVGFAGSTADAFTLLQKFEEKLEAHRGGLQRASIELAKEWRTDRYLRKLEAMLIAMTNTEAYIISGTGDVVQPDDNIVAIGSGGSFALSAARALTKHSNLSAREIVEESLRIASEICIYTNDQINIEEL